VADLATSVSRRRVKTGDAVNERRTAGSRVPRRGQVGEPGGKFRTAPVSNDGKNCWRVGGGGGGGGGSGAPRKKFVFLHCFGLPGRRVGGRPRRKKKQTQKKKTNKKKKKKKKKTKKKPGRSRLRIGVAGHVERPRGRGPPGGGRWWGGRIANFRSSSVWRSLLPHRYLVAGLPS